MRSTRTMRACGVITIYTIHLYIVYDRLIVCAMNMLCNVAYSEGIHIAEILKLKCLYLLA